MGNILTKNDIQKITLKQKGGSTLGGRQVWFDRDVLRLNYDNRGEYLGEFLSEDSILVVSSKGTFYTSNFDLSNHYEKDILVIEKFDANKVWSVALYDADQKYYYLKRFQLEATTKPQNFLGDNPESRLMLMTDADFPRFEVVFGGNDSFRDALVVDGEEFIGVKSYKAKGKRLTTFEVDTINELEPVRFAPVKETNNNEEGSDTADDTESAEIDVEDNTVTVEDKELAEYSDEPELTVTQAKPQKKEKPAKPAETQTTDDVIDQQRIIDDLTGQMTLF